MMQISKRKILVGGIIFLLVSVIFLFFDKGQEKKIKIGELTGDSIKKEGTSSKENLENKIASDKITAKPTKIKPKKEVVTQNQVQGGVGLVPENKEKDNIPAVSVSQEEIPKIINHLVTWGFTPTKGRKIDTIIIHSSYNIVGDDTHNLEDIINKEYRPAGVSPHYIISRQGAIYRLVKDKDIAYHAGVSKMPDGRTGVNNFSLGIEVVETKTESPTKNQYVALKKLVDYLKSKYTIKYVLGHSDIAPGRKTDPWNFDWQEIGKKIKN